MKNQDEYSIYEPILEEEEVLADDIPLCSLDKIIQSIEPKIKAGYIQNVVALRFGYSITILLLKRWNSFPDMMQIAITLCLLGLLSVPMLINLKKTINLIMNPKFE